MLRRISVTTNARRDYVSAPPLPCHHESMEASIVLLNAFRRHGMPKKQSGNARVLVTCVVQLHKISQQSPYSSRRACVNLLYLQRCERCRRVGWKCMLRKTAYDTTCFLSQQLTRARTPASRGCSSSIGISKEERKRSQVSIATVMYCHQIKHEQWTEKNTRLRDGGERYEPV